MAVTIHPIYEHPAPVWEGENGARRPGLEYDPSAPRIVGWCHVLVADINGERHRLLLTEDGR